MQQTVAQQAGGQASYLPVHAPCSTAQCSTGAADLSRHTGRQRNAAACCAACRRAAQQSMAQHSRVQRTNANLSGVADLAHHRGEGDDAALLLLAHHLGRRLQLIGSKTKTCKSSLHIRLCGPARPVGSDWPGKKRTCHHFWLPAANSPGRRRTHTRGPNETSVCTSNPPGRRRTRPTGSHQSPPAQSEVHRTCLQQQPTQLCACFRCTAKDAAVLSCWLAAVAHVQSPASGPSGCNCLALLSAVHVTQPASGHFSLGWIQTAFTCQSSGFICIISLSRVMPALFTCRHGNAGLESYERYAWAGS